MIDYTIFGFAMAVLLVGVWYACTSANISGENDVEDDGRGHSSPFSNVVRFARRRPSSHDKKPETRD